MKVTLALTLIEQAVIIVVALTSLLVIVFFIVKRGFKTSNEPEEDISIDEKLLSDNIYWDNSKLKSTSTVVAKTPKKFKNKYKYSRITKSDIKEYTGLYPNKLSEKLLIDTILRLNGINYKKNISPRSVYLLESLANTAKRIDGINTSTLSKYFRNEDLSITAIILIEGFLDNNIKYTYIV